MTCATGITILDVNTQSDTAYSLKLLLLADFELGPPSAPVANSSSALDPRLLSSCNHLVLPQPIASVDSTSN